MRGAARRQLRSWSRNQKGAAAIDFAVVSIPLLVIAFGIMEFGRYIWVQEALQSTVSTVARCMGLSLANCSASGVYSASVTTAYAQTVAQQWGVTVPSANVALNAATSCPGMSGSTGYAEITISYAFSTVAASLIPALASKTISAKACFPN